MDILAELGRGTQNDLLSVEGWLLAVRETLRLKRGRGLFLLDIHATRDSE